LISARKPRPTSNWSPTRPPPPSAPSARSRRPKIAKVFEVLQKYDIRYFFYIGGNDSAETTHIVNEEAIAAGYD
jgi:6-phosphofructokinase